MFYIDNALFIIDPNHIDRKLHIFHPHFMAIVMVKYEQHGIILINSQPSRQAFPLRFFIISNFRPKHRLIQVNHFRFWRNRSKSIKNCPTNNHQHTADKYPFDDSLSYCRVTRLVHKPIITSLCLSADFIFFIATLGVSIDVFNYLSSHISASNFLNSKSWTSVNLQYQSTTT